MKIEMLKNNIVEIEGKFFYEASMIETFPFPPPVSRKATEDDFRRVGDIKKVFKIGVIFFHQNRHGFFDRYTSTLDTNIVDLKIDIQKGRIFIPLSKTENNENDN